MYRRWLARPKRRFKKTSSIKTRAPTGEIIPGRLHAAARLIDAVARTPFLRIARSSLAPTRVMLAKPDEISHSLADASICRMHI